MTKAAEKAAVDVSGVWYCPEFGRVLGHDVAAILMASQIFYWYRPGGKDLQSKLRVQRDGMWWIAKSYREWFDETGLSQEQARRATNVLKEAKIVEVKNFRFSGELTRHYRLTIAQGKRVTYDTPDSIIQLAMGLKDFPKLLGQIGS